MIMNKDNWIQQVMETMNYRLVEEYIQEYNVSEYETRIRLAEMFYNDTFEYKEKDNMEDDGDSQVTGYLQY